MKNSTILYALAAFGLAYFVARKILRPAAKPARATIADTFANKDAAIEAFSSPAFRRGVTLQ